MIRLNINRCIRSGCRETSDPVASRVPKSHDFDYAENRLPIFRRGNLYLNRAERGVSTLSLTRIHPATDDHAHDGSNH